jgi:cellulose synthase/poly-beta-1,6-N-acetylglucosamine synthase-like glycosyltransferase
MLEILLIIFCGLLSIPVLVLFVQVVMALISPRILVDSSPEQKFSFAVLIPAHNEEPVISETINSIKSQLGKEGRLYVVADNCTDDTARIAAELGAEVYIRKSPDKLGKGYALDFGIEQIALAAVKPDVLVVVDADCIVEEEGLNKLVAKCIQVKRPVQAIYLMHANATSPGQKIAEFAYLVKCWVRPLGYLHLDFPCQLVGSGMAFPFELLSEVSMANSSIVEDLKLGIDLARKGYSPVFCPGACVVSVFPGEQISAESQRTRWEHGHLGVIASEGASLVIDAVKNADLRLLAMAFDLMVPPLALLAMILCVATTVTGLASLHSGITGTPFLVMLVACSLFALSVLLAWLGFARHIISFKDLVCIPGYIFSKIPMYIRFWTRRQKDWVRTNRD